MKILTLIITSLISILISDGQSKTPQIPASRRVEKTINSHWTFNYFPAESAGKGYESPGLDDSRWFAVSIPHTWGTFETTGELPNAGQEDNPYWWTGWGWYRKHFTINPEYSDRKIFIEFEGVQKYCKIWINGIYLGDHKGGYGSFDFDLTPHIKKGSDNLIAVAVNDSMNDRISDMASGSFYFSSGICNDVKIVLKDKLYIPMQGAASHEGGTFITTPGLTAGSGTVRILTWVKNDNAQDKSCMLQTTILDAAGKTVQTIRSTAEIKRGQLYRFDQLTKPVRNPHLWSIEDPYLYKVISEVSDGKNMVDAFSGPLGFRWLSWDNKDNSLYLNGKKTMLRAENLDRKYPWLGDAISAWITLQELTGMAKNNDHNSLITTYCNNKKAIYDLADKSGILIAEVLPDAKNNDLTADMEQQIKEVIRRGRNHPGIVLWSISRETNKALSSKLIFAEDTTRIISESIADITIEDRNLTALGDRETIAGKIPAGEAIKIVPELLQARLPADRGSVAMIRAHLVDSNGNRVIGSDNILKWSVSGPATLIGPGIFESGTGNNYGIEKYGNRNDPAVNMVRSTGEPGKVRVSVFSSGLVSASVDVIFEEAGTDNSIINEPVLKNEGRTGVERISFETARLEEVPREIDLITEGINLNSPDRSGYKKAMRDFISKNNPSVDSSTVEFKYLADLLSRHLFNNNGQIAAADFNFNADHYNNCRLISGYINATKLPQLFKDGLRIYYANSIIVKGNEKNAGDEMNWLNWIPSGGTVIYYSEDNKIVPVSGARITDKNELSDLIAIVHPGFEIFSNDARERALEFITKMNPYVHPVSVSSTIDGKVVTKTTILAEKGKPVLIPLIKFIAE